MDLSEEGGDVLHDWIDQCDTKANLHARKSNRLQTYSLSLRSFLVICTSTTSLVSFTRALMYSSSVDLYYGSVLFVTAFLVAFFFGQSSLDKSTFHLRMMHELNFMKFRCSFLLTERRSPEKIREEFQSVMTRSNKMMNSM